MSQLNEKQQAAIQNVVSGRNLYISGPGGVGKSFLIKHIVNQFSDSTVVLAPTGIAALNIGGSTVHSAFRLPANLLTKQHWTKYSDKAEELFSKSGPVKRIVLDEVSMNRADVFTTIDQQLRRIRRTNVPFGGLQIICVGDFYQLPPVISNQEKKVFFELYDSGFAFGSETWSSANFEYIELTENMRQSDETFRMHLGRIRMKLPGFQDSVDFFNKNARKNKDKVLDSDPIYLCTVNRVADEINLGHYNDLDGEEHEFFAQKVGDFKAEPAPYHLKLKYGTKVIFTCNTPEFKNGEMGYFLEKVGDKLLFIKENESEVLVSQTKWENKEYEVNGDNLDTKVTGTYTQYPVKHAWAVSIHKSQGLTLDHVVIDWGRGAFCAGQAYVALSRLRTLEGLTMTGDMGTSDIIVDPEVQEFYKNGCKGIGLF